MFCDMDKEKLEAFVLGFLPEAEKAHLAKHFQICPDCVKVAAQLKKSSQILDRAFMENPPETLVQKTIFAMQAKTKVGRLRLIWGGAALAGVMAMTLLMLWQPTGFFSLRFKPQLQSAASVSKSEAEVMVSLDYKTPMAKMAAGRREKSSQMNIIPDEFDQSLANPIHDRSIYQNLGVATEVAKLLL
jgi:hypothetical protein